MSNDNASLYRKLAEIAGAVGRVAKDGKNKDKGYSYPTPAAVFLAVKDELADRQIAIIPADVEIRTEDTGRTSGGGNPYWMTYVTTDYLIVDGETGASLTRRWHGQAGTYADDKGVAKARTISLRTFLIQLFQMPASDADLDPDAGDPRDTHKPQQQRQQAQPAQPAANGNGHAGGMTEKQNNMLWALSNKLGVDLRAWAQESYKVEVDRLSSKQASALIDELKRMEAEQEQPT